MANVNIVFDPKQQEAYNILNSPGIEVLGFGGAKGGGKSWFLRTRQVLRRLKYPKSSGLIVRKTLGELEKNHIRKIQQEWPELAYDYRDQKHQFKFKNGSILDMTYVDTEQDVERIRGIEYDDIDIDEATQHPEIVFSELRSCLRTSNAVNLRAGMRPTMLLTWNWGGIGHAWIKRKFWRKYMVKNKPDGIDAEEWRRIQAADTWDNPEHWNIDPVTGLGEDPKQFAFLQAFYYDNSHLDNGYAARLSALPETLRKAYMDGDPDIFEGQFFPEFGPHLRERPVYIPVNVANLIGSLDYGEGTGEGAGATSFGLWHLDAKGTPHRLWTYYKKGQTASIYAREIAAGIQSFPYTYGVMPKKIVADPSMFIKRRMDMGQVGDERSRSVADIFADHGLALTPANNDRVNGWRVMREYFSRDSLTAVPKSYYFDGYNEEYEMYIPTLVYSKTNASDVKKGGEDHVGDEARYGMVEMMGDAAARRRTTTTRPDGGPRLIPLRAQLKPLFFSAKRG
jgi:phage terminase large subunit